MSWLSQNLPEHGRYISTSSYYADDTHTVAGVVLADVSISVKTGQRQFHIAEGCVDRF